MSNEKKSEKRVFSIGQLSAEVTAECEKHKTKAALVKAVTAVKLNIKDSREAMIIQIIKNQVIGLLETRLAELDERSLVLIVTSSNFCGIEPCPLQPNIIEAIKASALANMDLAESILNFAPEPAKSEIPFGTPPPDKQKKPVIEKDPVLALATALDISPSAASRIIAEKERKKSIKTEIPFGTPPPDKQKKPVIEKDPVLALATALDISPGAASRIIAEKERKKSIKTERDTEKKRLEAEVQTPLTRDDRVRMSEISIAANRGRGHPDARDMAWLGRARQRSKITPLNADERRQFRHLDEIEITNKQLFDDDRPEEITPLSDQQLAEYKVLKERSEI